MPIEEMARRGPDTLAFGPMRPVGLIDPRTVSGRTPACSSRQDDARGRLFNMVGFQTKMTYREQRRVFRMIPGLERRSSSGSAACTATRMSTARSARRAAEVNESEPPVEKLRSVEIRVAVQPAEAGELSVREPRNGPEQRRLCGVFQLGLEAHHVNRVPSALSWRSCTTA